MISTSHLDISQSVFDLIFATLKIAEKLSTEQ